MSRLPDAAQGSRPPVGLCDTCAHQQVVRNTRGSAFSLCKRSREQPEYPRYPRLPVLACTGYERRARDEGESDPSRA